MTDVNQIDQDVELHDEDVMEAKGHDPANAPAQAVAATDAAANATKETDRGDDGEADDEEQQDPMPKTKAGMINAMYQKMNAMKKPELMAGYKAMMSGKHMAKEDFDTDEDAVSEITYKADFSADLNALVNEEATLSDSFKDKAETIFEAAIKSKLSEEIDRLEAKYEEELAEEIQTTRTDLVEKVDSYLNYVVEQWVDDNKVAIQAGLRTEIAENFMNKMKDLFTESYVDVPESKVDLVDELAAENQELEEKLNAATGQAIAMTEELEVLQKNAVIAEASTGLAETQVEKLKSLVEDVDFTDVETFTAKVATIKESYFTKAPTVAEEVVEEDDAFVANASDAMSVYLNAIKKTSK